MDGILFTQPAGCGTSVLPSETRYVAKSTRGPDPVQPSPRLRLPTGPSMPPSSHEGAATNATPTSLPPIGQLGPPIPLPETATFLGTAQALWSGDALRALIARANRMLAEQLSATYGGDKPRSGCPDDYLLDTSQRILNRLANLSWTNGRKLNATERIAILRTAISILEHDLGIKDPPKLPSTAPTYWADRNPEGAMNPAEFTRAIYGRWIGNGLTRQQLRKLDYPLYRALSVWESRHPDDRIKELPTITEVVDRKIAALSKELDPDELRKLASTLQNRHRMSKT